MPAKSHGHTRFNFSSQRSSTYTTWENIKQRCLNPKNTNYPRYGGKGIKICDRWLEFENFLEDMGEKPFKGWHCARKGDIGDYTKENCEWKSPRDNKSEAHRGEKASSAVLTEDKVKQIKILHKQGLTQAALGRHFGVTRGCIWRIIKRKSWAHVS